MERRAIVFVTCILLMLTQDAMSAPLFKVFCSGRPLYRGRVDPIVSPGLVSGHIHKVAGGSNFGAATATATPLQVYNDMVASPCTTCSIKTVDNSAYWHPDLFYKWPNGSLSLVPSGGLTVYYLFRGGSGAQANPAWKAFPPGFRMVSGNPFRRSYNDSRIADQAISFVCLGDGTIPETHYLQTATYFCKNGLRLQVHFPQCWDGVNLDSPTHTSHVAFATAPDHGDCPATHPVRIPDIFFEAFYSVDKFPHGTGTQPFVLAPGDTTGYGFHGDFLNGWNQDVLQAAIRDPSCDSTNTNNGNNVAACAPLAPYLQSTPEGACSLNKDIPLNEFFNFGTTGTTLAGCNPLTSGPAAAVPCAGTTAATFKPAVTTRFHIKSVSTGKYWRAPALSTNPVLATSTKLTYWETFTAVPFSGGYVGLLNDVTMKYCSADLASSSLSSSRGDGQVQDWELFKIVAQSGGNVAIYAKKNNNTLTVQADGSVGATSTTIGTAQLFTLVTPAGGSI